MTAHGIDGISNARISIPLAHSTLLTRHSSLATPHSTPRLPVSCRVTRCPSSPFRTIPRRLRASTRTCRTRTGRRRPSTRRPRAVQGTAMLRLLHWSASRSPRRRAARRGSGPGRAGTSPRSSGPRRTRSGSASRRPRQPSRTIVLARSKRAETPANSKTSRNSPPGRHTYKQQREPGRCV